MALALGFGVTLGIGLTYMGLRLFPRFRAFVLDGLPKE
jgi:hypothetical protein